MHAILQESLHKSHTALEHQHRIHKRDAETRLQEAALALERAQRQLQMVTIERDGSRKREHAFRADLARWEGVRMRVGTLVERPRESAQGSDEVNAMSGGGSAAEGVLRDVLALMERGTDADVVHACVDAYQRSDYDEAFEAGLKSACGALDELDASMLASFAAMERNLLRERQKASDMRESLTRCVCVYHVCMCHVCMCV
jgi:hypothetical protein